MESLARLGISGWDLLLYAVNFGLVVWLVARYMTKPMLKMLDERRDTIKNNIEGAEKLRGEMAQQKELMEKQKIEMQSQLADELSKAKAEMQIKRKEADADIETKRAKMLEEVRAVVESEKQKIMQNTEAETLALMQKIILNIVSNQIPQEVVQSSVQSAWKSYKGQ